MRASEVDVDELSNLLSLSINVPAPSFPESIVPLFQRQAQQRVKFICLSCNTFYNSLRAYGSFRRRKHVNIKTYVSRIIREPVDLALRLLPDAGRSAARESRLTRLRRRQLHEERTDLHGISEENKHWQTGAIINSVQPKTFDLLLTDHLLSFSPKRKGSRYARLI